MVKRKIADTSVTVFLCITAAAVISPAVIVALLSFGEGAKTYADFYLWEPRYLYAMSNSIITASAAAFGTVAVAVPAAYVFSKLKFRGRDILFYLYIIVMMMPFQVTLLPQYIVSKSLSTYDTLFSLILPGVFAPFAVFLLTQVMKSVPDEVIEAAQLDTSSTFVIILRIIVPAVKPGIICAWVLSFTEQWNAVAEPLILIETKAKYPLAVMLNGITSNNVLGFASAVMFMLPPLLMFFYFESEIMEGLGEYRLK